MAAVVLLGMHSRALHGSPTALAAQISPEKISTGACNHGAMSVTNVQVKFQLQSTTAPVSLSTATKLVAVKQTATRILLGSPMHHGLQDVLLILTATTPTRFTKPAIALACIRARIWPAPLTRTIRQTIQVSTRTSQTSRAMELSARHGTKYQERHGFPTVLLTRTGATRTTTGA